MKRYNPGRLGGYPAPMFEAEDGAYVRLEDVEHLLRTSAKHPEEVTGTEVWAVEDAGIIHRYIAISDQEAREIHRGFQPIDVEERWVVRRVP